MDENNKPLPKGIRILIWIGKMIGLGLLILLLLEVYKII